MQILTCMVYQEIFTTELKLKLKLNYILKWGGIGKIASIIPLNCIMWWKLYVEYTFMKPALAMTKAIHQCFV